MLSQVSAGGSSSLNAAGRNAAVTSLMICCGFVVCWSLDQISYFLNIIGVVKMDFILLEHRRRGQDGFLGMVLPLHRGAGAAQQLHQSFHLRRQVS